MKIITVRLRLLLLFIIFSFFVFTINVNSQTNVRTEIKIPNILGFTTLKCDFHIHTIFSDGSVWPTIRPQEVWLEGLDAFSITDHIEYQPHKKDVPTNHNRSYELALPRAREVNLIFIKGSEITRGEPPGHLNAIFLKDSNPLDTKDYRDAVKLAVEQGAFVFWNHPGWKQPNLKAVFYKEQNELYKKGWLHGMEVVNGDEYYPEVHKWCLEKNLTMMGNSDIHNPINFNYNFQNGNHRPMTLVLAKEKSENAIKEALFAHRTVVWDENVLIGEEKYLSPLFNESIEIKNPNITIRGKGRSYIQIYNKSDVSFELIAEGESKDITFPKNVTLYADKTVLLGISGKSEKMVGKKGVQIPYQVQNLWIAPKKGLSIKLNIDVDYIPSDKK